MSDRVSPTQGKESIAPPSVTKANDPSITGSRPVLFSQYRGPLLYNETDEERKKREEEERKRKEDEEKRTNFDKVREKAEREEAARKKAEEERDALIEEKRKREEEERKAAEEKLEEEKQYQTLAEQREAEAKAKSEEAEKEKARADDAEARLKEIEDEQEKELEELLKTIPEDKQPPLDATDPVVKRLQQVKYAKSLLDNSDPDPIGGTPTPKNEGNQDRLKELKKAQKERPLSSDEALELAELSEEKKD